MLLEQVEEVEDRFVEVREDRAREGVTTPFGLILNVESEAGFPLKFTRLEKAATANRPEVSVLNIRQQDTDDGLITKAAVFVPDGQLVDLVRKIRSYADPKKDGKYAPANAELLENISRIGVAALEALWTDHDILVARGELVWWECWVRRSQDRDWLDQFLTECQRLNIEVDEARLVLPDHLILLIHATREQIEDSIDLLNTLSEVRKPRPCSYELMELAGDYQQDLIDDALERIFWPRADASAVCLIVPVSTQATLF
jgi:hypothetical protein